MISEYISKIEADLQIKADANEKKSAELLEIEATIASKQKELNKFEKELKESERALKVRELACKKIEDKLESEEALKALALKTEQDKEASVKLAKEASEKLGDVKTALEVVAKRESAVNAKERDYKEQVKKEFVDKFIGKI